MTQASLQLNAPTPLSKKVLGVLRRGQKPRGWKEVTPDELGWTRMGTYMPSHYINAGIKDQKNGFPDYYDVFVFWDGTGVAWKRCWKYDFKSIPPDVENDMTIKFYKFGCHHKFRELGGRECNERDIYHAGNCYHVQECTLCGFIEAHDTSD
jgi:hypothetical protein